ncbi:hypothetical protein [Tritonibacter mobilis]|uniref:hypothetical protein n=1 Tax=Tritonibacter mobilis TaxID=379347 RepID=UPI0039A406D9
MLSTRFGSGRRFDRHGRSAGRSGCEGRTAAEFDDEGAHARGQQGHHRVAPDCPNDTLGFTYARRNPIWRETGSRLPATDGYNLAVLALHGNGAARVGRFFITEELAAGRLQVVAEAPTIWEGQVDK